MAGLPAPTGQPFTIDLPPAIASKLAIYAGEHLALLAPRGWECSANDGNDNMSLFVYPSGSSAATAGPIIATRVDGGGTENSINLTLAYAARYFPRSISANEVSAAAAEDGSAPSDILNLAPRFKTDRIVYLTQSLLEFTTPAGNPGLGNEILTTSSKLKTLGLLEVEVSNVGDDDTVSVFAMRTISPDLRKYIFGFEENCALYNSAACTPNAQYAAPSDDNQ